MTDSDDVRVAIAKIDAKLDVALAQHGAKQEQHNREIAELRARVDKLEEQPRVAPEDVRDHEARLRIIERTPTVSPRQLGAVVFAAVGAVGALSPLLDRLYS